MKKLIGFVLLLVFIPTSCFANVGLPMIFINLPFLTIALIPVIIIEASIVRTGLGISLKQSYKYSSLANLASTLIGYPIAWALHVLLMFVTIAPLSYFLSTKYEINQNNIILQMLSLTVGGAWIMPTENHGLIILAMISCMVTAFFASYYAESFVLIRLLKSANKDLIKRISWKANLTSYCVIVLLLLAYAVYLLVTESKIPFN